MASDEGIMARTRDLIGNGGFEKKHGWSIAEHGGSQNYFKSGVYDADNRHIAAFADRFGLAYAPPSEGSNAFYTEWDGAPGKVVVSQTVNLAKTVSDVLSFDYEAAWDLKSYNAKADRSFTVRITDKDTGEVRDVTVLVAHHGEREADTGLQHFSLDISEFAGDRVAIDFVWDAPGRNDGPALFMLDNVELVGTSKGGHEAAAEPPIAEPQADLQVDPDHFLV
jgi:hypothetical protein